MKKRIKLFSTILALGALTIGSLIAISTVGNNGSLFANQTRSPYTMTFNKSQNKITDSTEFIGTTEPFKKPYDLDSKSNKVECIAQNVKDYKDGWATFNNNSYFRNYEHIVGMDSLNLNCELDASSTNSATIYVYYYHFYGITIDPSVKTVQTLILEKGVTYNQDFDFKGYHPNFFYIDVKGGPINFNSMKITINETCHDFYPNILIESEDTNKGVALTHGGHYAQGSKLTLTAEANTGYVFAGWYMDGEFISDEIEHVVTIPDHPVKFIARFSEKESTLFVKSYIASHKSFGGGTFTINGESCDQIKVKYKEKVALKAFSSSGYAFIGWYKNLDQSSNLSTDLEYVFTMKEKDTTLYAVFDVLYKVNVETYKGYEAFGRVEGSGEYTPSENVKIRAIPNPGYRFFEWVDENGVAYKNLNSAEFTLHPTSNVSYYAKFKKDLPLEYLVGEYPQSIENDPEIIIELNEFIKNGTIKPSEDPTWTAYSTTYINSTDNKQDKRFFKDFTYADNHQKYRAVYMSETPENPNGYEVDKIYFFRYEPIIWTTISNDNLVTSKYILDSSQNFYHFYDNSVLGEKPAINPNDYSNSNVRSWLNGNFYQTAFNDIDKGKIFPTTIDTVKDNVFLLSDDDVSNYDYGFKDDDSRMTIATDYAKCMGNLTHEYSKKTYGDYFLRTPAETNNSCVYYVNGKGLITDIGGHVNYEIMGIRPAMTLKLN